MSARPRAREVGVPFDGRTGPGNAITDVPGVRVGHATLIRDGKPDLSDAIRTGVTAILPTREIGTEPVFAGWYRQNGAGELTGTAWIDESGLLDGPILTTNTLSVGVVRDAVVEWSRDHGLAIGRWSLPVVGETWDGYLNDILGLHVSSRDAALAIDRAEDGPVAEGNVGGGTGMRCYEFKGGIGTSSRRLDGNPAYTLGVLVQANHGSRSQLRIAGLPIGRWLPVETAPEPAGGSILIFVATDAPLLPHQLARLARRTTLGLGRTGSISENGSGDFALAFSTANRGSVETDGIRHLAALADGGLDPLFEATVQATEEAIVNALFRAETMVGHQGHRVEALPVDRLRGFLEARPGPRGSG